MISSKYHLCIDGGGTKTIAVISDLDGNILATGQAGPSNLTAGVKHTVNAIVSAVQQALSLIPTQSSSSTHPVFPSSSPIFKSVWVGIAGCARPPDKILLAPFIVGLFPGSQWRLGNDAELLASPLASIEDCSEVVTVICGTGSLAIRWKRSNYGSQVDSVDTLEPENGEPMELPNFVLQTQRSGGWGSLLGDEGSGWSLGREALKSVLTYSANGIQHPSWHKQILEKYNISHANQLLPAFKLSDEHQSVGASRQEAERKLKIASCTRIVIDVAREGDDEALRLVEKVVGEVIELIRPLTLDGKGYKGSATRETLLVLGGGLSGVDIFRSRVIERMKLEGWEWRDIRVINDPAIEGVKALSKRS